MGRRLKLGRLERFMSYIDKNGPFCEKLKTHCWLWNGGHAHSYGMFYWGPPNETIHAHVASYRFFVKANHKKHIHHRCENRGCVNPEHLIDLTPLEHMKEHGLVGDIRPQGDNTNRWKRELIRWRARMKQKQLSEVVDKQPARYRHNLIVHRKQ
jgi:hypothetical protein